MTLDEQIKQAQSLIEYRKKLSNFIFNEEMLEKVYNITLEEIEAGRILNLEEAYSLYKETMELYVKYYKEKFRKSERMWLSIAYDNNYLKKKDREDKLVKLDAEQRNTEKYKLLAKIARLEEKINKQNE